MISTTIGDLIEKYLDASLSEPETRTLEAWLRESAANMDAFIRQVDVHVGLEHALAKLPESASAPAPKRRVLRWPVAVPLAAAAGLLVAVGLSFLTRVERINAGPFMAARVIQCDGEAVRQPAKGRELAVRASDALARGDRLITRPGTRATIQLADGSIVDLNEKTEIRLNSPIDSEALSLASGKLYCVVAPRSAGTAPFAVALANRCRAVAMGTRFELAVGPDAAARLVVEEGKVRLESPASAPREVTTMQAASVSPAGAIATPEPAPLYAIAAWKFKPDSVPDNTILFQSAFDTPESTNSLLSGSGQWQFDTGKGVNRSGCLVLNIKPAQRVTFCPKIDVRQKHFEISFDVLDPQKCQFYLGPAFDVPTQPGSPVLMCKPYQRYTDSNVIPAGQWLHAQVVVRGNTVEEKWFDGSKLVHQGKGHVSDDLAGFSRVWLCGAPAPDQDASMDLYVDNLVIRKIPSAPYDKVIFHDEFQSGSLADWRIFQGNFSVVEGQALGGGRCLQLNWDPAQPAAIYANCDLQNRDFMMQFLVRTPTTVAYTPVLSISTTNLNEVADAEHTGGGFRPGASIPNDQWVGHRFIVKGRSIAHQTGNDGVFFYERTARITHPRPYVLPGLLFVKTRQPCKAYVDNVLITVTDE